MSQLDCSYNSISELDFSENPRFGYINCLGNPLTALDFSDKQYITFCDSIVAEGNGYISCVFDFQAGNYIMATPVDGSIFDGWYSKDGTLLSEDERFDLKDGFTGALLTDVVDFVAKFFTNPETPTPTPEPPETPTPTPPVDEGIPGDADGSGEIEVADALKVMRHALGLEKLSDEAVLLCDMDDDGKILVADGLVIARMAMDLLN